MLSASNRIKAAVHIRAANRGATEAASRHTSAHTLQTKSGSTVCTLDRRAHMNTQAGAQMHHCKCIWSCGTLLTRKTALVGAKRNDAFCVWTWKKMRVFDSIASSEHSLMSPKEVRVGSRCREHYFDTKFRASTFVKVKKRSCRQLNVNRLSGGEDRGGCVAQVQPFNCTWKLLAVLPNHILHSCL